MSQAIRRHVVVRGEVQGVGFRAWTTREASRIGVTGFVTNLADGSVEAEIEGTPDAVTALLDWMRAGGPRWARVDAIDVHEATPSGSTAFEIR